MSNLVDHAVRELDIVAPVDTSADDAGYNWAHSIRNAVLDLVQLFADQGHSGMSAALTVDTFVKLARFEALSPITDDPQDWIEVGPEVWQCRRQSNAFSNDGGKTYTTLETGGEVFTSKDHTEKLTDQDS